MIRLLALGLVLAGCARETPTTAFRQPDAQMSSVAVIEPLRFDGRWYEVAGFVADGGACAVGAMTFTVQRDGTFAVREGPCDGRPAKAYLASQTGPGRLTPRDGGEPLWILWVDGDYRTMVVGTPSGRFGYVLNRSRDIPPDRMAAARDILAWNGYDLARLSGQGVQ